LGCLHFKVLVDRSKVKIGEPHKFDELGWFNLNNLPKKSSFRTAEIFQKYEKRLNIALFPKIKHQINTFLFT